MPNVVNKTSFSIGRRLALGLGLILAITSGAAAYGIYHLGQIAQDYKRLSADSFALERDTQEWIGVLTITGARSLIGARFADTEATNETFTAFRIADPATNRARVTELVKNISTQIDTQEGRALLADMVAKRKAYNDAQDAAKQLLTDAKPKEAQAYAKATMQPALRGYINASNAVQDYARKTIAQREEATQAQAASARTWVSVLTVLSVLLGIAIAWLMSRRITTPLKQAVAVAEKVAAGDLRSRVEVKGNDETGALLAAISTMQDNLKELIGNVQRDVGAVSSSASQLAVAANELSSSTASQNEAVSSTAASVEELTVSISQMSDSAQLAQDVVEATVKVSDAGLDMGNKVSREIGEIDRSVEDFAQQMQALQGQAGEIGTVIKLIKEIADQTNLLALNAAIEAARAGEQGRGFAVVADEVRKLAERTGSATNEIQKTIEAIQSNMGACGSLLENVKTRVDTGVATIADLIAPLKTLQSQAERAASGLRELTNATREQQQASEQIARNTERIASSAEENHASVSQSRDTSHELSALADRLMGSMTRFQM